MHVEKLPISGMEDGEDKDLRPGGEPGVQVWKKCTHLYC